MAVLSDTLKFVRELRSSFSQEQAEALATAVAGSAQDTIATKAGIAALRAEMIERKAELKGDIATVKIDLVRWIVGAISFQLRRDRRLRRHRHEAL